MDLRAAPRIITPVLGAACWTQLALAPLLARRPNVGGVAAAVLALAALAFGLRTSEAQPPRALLAYAGAFPLLLGVGAVLAAGASPARYDAPGQLVVAVTVVAFLSAVAWSWSARRERVPAMVIASTVPAATTPAPPLRLVGVVALVTVAALLAVVAPLGVSRAAAFHGARAGAGLLRGRLALVTAGGLTLAIVWTFLAGGALLRRGPVVPRSGARAWFYLCAATVAFAMRYWLDHSR